MNIWEQFKRSLAIAKKDLSIYYLRAPVMIQGLLIPAFLFISFSFKRSIPLELLITGLLGMALFFAVSAITPVIAPWETKMKTFERLASSPIALWAILLGDIMASALFGLFIVFFIALVSVLVLGWEIITWPLVVGTIVAAFCFSSLGVLISARPTDNPSDVMLIATLLKFPLIFISGVFVPIAEMGSFRILSFLSPLTYYTDLARYSIQGASEFSPIFNLIVIFFFMVVFSTVAFLWHKKSLGKRF